MPHTQVEGSTQKNTIIKIRRISRLHSGSSNAKQDFFLFSFLNQNMDFFEQKVIEFSFNRNLKPRVKIIEAQVRPDI